MKDCGTYFRFWEGKRVPATMMAAVLHGKDDLRIEEIPAPEPSDGEVLVKIEAAGICGSDLPRVLGDAAHFYPIVLGHEFSGVVTSVGRGVEDVHAGDRVAGIPLLPCHACRDCQMGRHAQCSRYSFIGSRAQGSFAEYVKLPARNALKLPDGMSFEEGALVEPATVALHALRRIGYTGGEDVAVLGGGNIGLLALQWATLFGARTVTVLDIDEDRLLTALRLGADHVVNTATVADVQSVCLEITAGRGFGVILETAGVTATMLQSFELAGRHARICFVGTPVKDLTFGHKLFEWMNRKEFLLTGSWMSYSAPFPGEEWENAIHFFASGRLRGSEVVFRRFPLMQARQAFDLYKIPGAVKGKILFV
jgi:L-iditol 2-dehydrogenase